MPGLQSGGLWEGKGSRPESTLSPPTTASWPRSKSRLGESGDLQKKTTSQIDAVISYLTYLTSSHVTVVHIVTGAVALG